MPSTIVAVANPDSICENHIERFLEARNQKVYSGNPNPRAPLFITSGCSNLAQLWEQKLDRQKARKYVGG
jgi:hypothetical protein